MISQRQDLNVKGAQTLVMMPRLQQAIHMLQLGNLELADFIEPFVEKNPFIKVGERHRSKRADWQDDLVSSAEYRESIYDTLNREIRLLAKDSDELELMMRILENTDIRTGVIEKTGPIIAKEVGVMASVVEAAVDKLQTVSLAGFFARDTKEGLKLRLARFGRLDALTAKILDNIDIVLKKNIHALAKKCGVSVESAIEAIVEVSRARPFTPFCDADSDEDVFPDVFVKKSDSGGFEVEINNETLPFLLIDEEYKDEVLTHRLSKSDTAFVRDNLAEANWLLKALDQRAKTILSVSKELVKRQQLFFTYGPLYLEPMCLKDISDAIGMHESTVSRVTSGKYILTEFGVFAMKSFFSNSMNGSDEIKVSCSVIKNMISKIIKSEKSAPYSDDEIAEKLLLDGISIARRTVSKYRSAMKIPGVRSRKKTKIISNLNLL